jgi:hypothetical protein
MSNSFEQLQLATLCLSQDGTIKDRLVDAYAGHLAKVDADQLPDNLRGDFKALCAAMQRETPLARESAVRASVRKMSLLEVREHAALVVRMFAAMARTESMSSVPRTPRASAPVLQLFAAAEA